MGLLAYLWIPSGDLARLQTDFEIIKKLSVADFLSIKSFDFVYMFIMYFSVTRLMGGSAGGSMGHAMSNMSGLAACSVGDSKPMQFPLTQRRKRRVLFTQAQVIFL